MADRSVVVRLIANTAGFAGPLKAAAVQAKAFGAEIDAGSQKNSEGFKKISEGALVAGGGIVAAFGGAVAVTMAFDKQMSSVGAAANATSGQLGQLRDAAIEAGSATAFGATDAARAEEELAKAGVSVKDILGGGLKGALDLAAAGQLDLGEAAETAATAMTQFGLSGDQVPHIADLLSAAANKAQGSVHDIGYALKAGGLVAAQFGISIEETTGTLAAFASAGLIGSDAGTSLKTMLIALANPSAKSATLMGELGISAYDAQGKFIGLGNLAGVLKDKLANLTQEQRNAALAQIFGTDAVRAASILYSQGADGIQKWTNNVNDTGNASRTAAAKMDNLSGDVEKLKGSLETALIQTGSQATGTLRTLSQAAESAVDGFTQLPGPAKEVVTVLGLTVGAALLAGGAYGTLAPKIRTARTEFAAMGPVATKMNTALGATAAFAGKAAAVLGAFQIASAAIGDSGEHSAVTIDQMAKSLQKLGDTGKVTGDMVDVLHGRTKALGDDLLALDSSGMGKVGNSIASTVESLTGLGSVMDSSLEHSKERIGEIDDALASMVTSGHADEAAAAYAKIEAIAKSKGISTSELKAGFDQYTQAVTTAKNAGDQAAAAELQQAQSTKTLANGFKEAASAADGLKTAWDTLNGAIANSDDAMLKANQAVDSMKESFEKNGKAVTGNTTAALENRVAMEAVGKAGADAAQAVLDGGGSIEQAHATWQRYHDQIVAALVQMGYVPAKAKQIADSLDQMPSLTAPKVEVTGTTESIAAVAAVDQQIKALQDKQVAIKEDGAPAAGAQILSMQNRIDALRDKTVQVKENGAIAAADRVIGFNNQIKALQDKIVKVNQSGAPDAQAKVKALQAQINALQNKVVQITANVEYKTLNTIPGVVAKGLRHGGVVRHAATGLMRQASIAADGSDVIHWAEHGTGDEAYVPRNGSMARSMSILQEAASWYGAQVTPAGSRTAMVAPSASTASASTVMSGPAIDYRKLAKAMTAAMGGVTVSIDGKKVGAIQGREADLYSRAG